MEREHRQRFIEALARSLDVKDAMSEADVTEDEARDIILGLGHPKPGLHAPLPHVQKGAHTHCDIFVDGASKGNPGPAGAGAIIKDAHGGAIKRLKKYLGTATNNVAEYSALIMALEAARALDIAHIKVHADSELMVKQINGVYRVKNEGLRPLYEKAVSLLKCFKTKSVTHVYREKNSEADRLANEAIESRA